MVGDAAAGERYFAARCASCHSVAGDLKGIGARDLGPAQLQNLWIAGGRGRGGGRGAPAAQAPPMTTRRETTVVVTLPGGQKHEGRLERIDDFIVTLTQADGTPRSFRRNGDVPRVDVRDPLETHRNLLPVYTDKDIYDVTAYLAGVK
jgi:cytochrome c oxidase cbb3-type subunit 3